MQQRCQQSLSRSVGERDEVDNPAHQTGRLPPYCPENRHFVPPAAPEMPQRDGMPVAV
jgi:hypothetical protein